MGTYRHDLLVAMRVVNKVELEMVRSEWESWLAGETRRCELARELLMRDGDGDGNGKERRQQGVAQSVLLPGERADERGGESEGQRRAALREWFEEYCTSCMAEQRAVYERSGLSF
jgi:hypothetical protein